MNISPPKRPCISTLAVEDSVKEMVFNMLYGFKKVRDWMTRTGDFRDHHPEQA